MRLSLQKIRVTGHCSGHVHVFTISREVNYDVHVNCYITNFLLTLVWPPHILNESPFSC